MISRTLRLGVLALLAIVLAGQTAVGLTFRSVGLRVLLPWTEVPFIVGVEASIDVSFGAVGGSFFITPNGRSLILGSADVRVGDEGSETQTFLRVTGGLLYVDTSRTFPTPSVGAGVVVQTPVLGPVTGGMSAEFVYPFAFPVPMFSLTGAWFLL